MNKFVEKEVDDYIEEPLSDFEQTMICLARLLDGDEVSDLVIVDLLAHLENMGLTLFDIGSSEVEMETAFFRGTRIAARVWLRRVRDAGSSLKRYNLRRFCFDKEILSGSISLSELGTSEEELEALRPKPKQK